MAFICSSSVGNRKMSRQKSIDKPSSLPRDSSIGGFGRKLQQAAQMRNRDFMKVPDSGQSGYVYFVFVFILHTDAYRHRNLYKTLFLVIRFWIHCTLEMDSKNVYII